MLTIGFFETKPWDRKYLKNKLKGYKVEFFNEELTEDNVQIAANFEIISIFIYSKINSKVVESLPELKMIATRSTGYDHIDLKECEKNKIIVCNVPSYGENTVAEHTFGLILALSRNIHKSYVRTLRDDFSIEGFSGFDLKSKTLGVIGGGHIGMYVVKIAKGFGMNVLVYDIKKNDFLAEVLNFKYSDLDRLLKESDIISLHTPYNKQTHHLINKESLKRVKKGSILINTARGGCVDTDALLWALEKGILGGAGLDVIEGEEFIKEEKQILYDEKNIDYWRTIVRDQKIFKMDNVVFTPHNAFNSQEALSRILDTTIQNINEYKDNNKIKNKLV
jgi:D-lactate dehydrogenase